MGFLIVCQAQMTSRWFHHPNRQKPRPFGITSELFTQKIEVYGGGTGILSFFFLLFSKKHKKRRSKFLCRHSVIAQKIAWKITSV